MFLVISYSITSVQIHIFATDSEREVGELFSSDRWAGWRPDLSRSVAALEAGVECGLRALQAPLQPTAAQKAVAEEERTCM